jgi:mRNA interferase MazF
MKIERGQVINCRFPHAAGGRGKKRPVVVVQADSYNQRLRHAVVVQLTTNLNDQHDPACFLIEAGSVDGESSGIVHDSVFCAYLKSLMSEDRLVDVIGRFTRESMKRADVCLQVALGTTFTDVNPEESVPRIIDGINSFVRDVLIPRGKLDEQSWDDPEMLRLKYEIAERIARTW